MLFRLLPAVLALALAPVLLSSLAVAAEAPTVVTVPVGDWIAAAVGWIGSLALAVAGFVVSRWVPTWARQHLTDRVLASAVDYALAAVAGAAKGKVLEIPVANAVLAEAMNYAILNAPALADWLGDTLRPKLIARLGAAEVLPPDASAANLTG